MDYMKQSIRKLFPMELLPWDEYFPAMAQTDYFLCRADVKATKAFFIRQAPFGGSYAILGGLHEFLRVLEDFEFTDEVIEAMLELGYQVDFLQYLKDMKTLKVTVRSIPEGGVFFPLEPVITVEGPLWAIRLVEGIMSSIVNPATLFMTKWHRIAMAAHPGRCMEFSRRRAQAPLHNTFYAHLAGVDYTSNSAIRQGTSFPTVGTMGHEWIQSIGDEYKAFDLWLEINPHKPVLLVDTIDTLKSGVPNAIKAFQAHRKRIEKFGGTMGIRNDSGDLAYLTLEERRLFDEAGLEDVVVFQTNDLDEYKIQNIKEQIFTQAERAGIKGVLEKTVWAAGTMPGTCYEQPSLGGVAKLTSITYKGVHRPVIKLAKDNPIKTSIPGHNTYSWVLQNGLLQASFIHEHNLVSRPSAIYHPDDNRKFMLIPEDAEIKPRQTVVYEPDVTPVDLPCKLVTQQIQDDLKMLHWTHKRFEQPHKMKVSLNKPIYETRHELIAQNKLIQDWG